MHPALWQGGRKLSRQLCLIQKLLLFSDYWLNPIYGPELYRGHNGGKKQQLKKIHKLKKKITS